METSLGYTQISCFFHSHKITDQCKTLKTSFFFTDHNLQKLLSFIKTIEETLKKKTRQNRELFVVHWDRGRNA